MTNSDPTPTKKPTRAKPRAASVVLKTDLIHDRKITPAGSPVPADLTTEQVERLLRLGHAEKT